MLKVKAFALTLGILWAFFVAWTFLIAMWGFGTDPFEVVNQLYLGFLLPDTKGLLIATGVGFIDGAIGGAIFAALYNLFAKEK